MSSPKDQTKTVPNTENDAWKPVERGLNPSASSIAATEGARSDYTRAPIPYVDWSGIERVSNDLTGSLAGTDGSHSKATLPGWPVGSAPADIPTMTVLLKTKPSSAYISKHASSTGTDSEADGTASIPQTIPCYPRGSAPEGLKTIPAKLQPKKS